MKQLFCIMLALALISKSHAKNYYISSSGNDANTGLTIGSAWQTITKVNSMFTSFVAGDSILFERGSTYFGLLIINKSGSSGNSIVLGAYGTGNKPIISGFTNTTGWTNVGTNLWQSSVIPGTNKPNMVLINNIATAMGRYPNSGYRTFQTSNANTSITDNTLSGTPNFTGGEVCVRKYHWYLSRDSITNHSGTTITYAGKSGYNCNDGFGYFVQNHIAALDVQNEWYFDRTSRKLTVYSTTAPSNVKISTIDTLTYIGGSDYITIDNIAFDGGNVSAIVFGSTTNQSISTTIKNCTLTNSGRDAIYGTNDDLSIINNNKIYSSYNNAIYLENEGGYSTNATITSNDIKLAGFIPGMGFANSAYGTNYSGITVYGSGPLIQYNIIDSVGYNPIGIYYNNSKVFNNLITNFCFVKDDGAGIYVLDMQGLVETGREITNNIIINSLGAGPGTSDGSSSQGIYTDDKADGVLIKGNTIANCSYSCLYVHNGTGITVTNNTLYNGLKMQQLFVHDSYGTGFPIRKVTNKNNILFAPSSNQLMANISTIRNDIDTMFTMIDSNIYARPVSPTGTTIHTTKTVSGTQVGNNYTLTTWKTSFPNWNIQSSELPLNTGVPELKYNASNNPITYTFTGLSKKDVYGTVYNNSAIIPAWGSKILMPNGSTAPGNINPIANAGIDKVITLPTNSTTLNGSGTDGDGTINSYVWVKISGPLTGTIATINAATTVINNLIQGIYQFELTVTDNNGAIGKDTVNVFVNTAANLSPIANAGTDKTITLPTNSTNLGGTGTDTDGTISSYAWRKISGPTSGTIATANAANTVVNNLVQGVYQFELTVTDNNGAIGKDTVNVFVNAAANLSPIANAGTDKTITLPTNSTNLAGTGTDTDGTISSYTWRKISGPTSGTIATANAANTAVNNLVQGVYQFELTATDNNGAIGKDTVNVFVNAAANLSPIANAGTDKTITLPTNSTNLAGTGTDTDGTISSYTWRKISGPTSGTIATANAANIAVNNLVQGVYQFELTVTDNNGAIGKDTVKVTVNAAPNLAPVANGGPDKTITLPTNTTNLTGTGNDTDGIISSYIWVKISGPATGTIATANAAATAINNLVPGIYQYELTVTDNIGATGKDTVKITVNAAPNLVPTAIAGINKSLILPTNTTTLTGTGTDADGTIVSYFWTKISGPISGTIITSNASATTVNNLVQGIYQYELAVTDNYGAIGKDTVQVTVNAALNQVPIANAGTDTVITLPINSSNLNGSGTDSDGTIVSFVWVKISGPAAGTIATPNIAISNVINLVQGIYQYELTVTDNAGAISKDIVQITVNAALNQPPVAKAGSDLSITLPTNNLTFSGTGIDPDGTISSYSWLKISGPAAGLISSPNTAITTVTNLIQGVYLFQLTVKDNKGATGKDTIQVTVNIAPNQAPVANAGADKSITLPTNSTSFNGVGTDMDGTISSYAWVKISGPATGAISSPNSGATAVNNLTVGIYEFELTVTDNSGAISKDKVVVTVNEAPNLAPQADAGTDQAIDLPINSTSLTGSGTDADGTIVSYKWTKISGPATGVIASSNSATTLLNNLILGIYNYELTVTDNMGAISKDTVQVTLNGAPNQAPVANAGTNKLITLPINSTTLNGSGTDADGTIASYIWTKISGPATGVIASPNLTATAVNSLVQGLYEFELTVTDNDGAMSKDTVQVTVNSALNQAPVANAGTNKLITLPINNTTLNGSGIDADGTIESYAWIKISGPSLGSIASPNAAITSINNLVQGIYKYELTVTDNMGAISKDIVQVTVNAAANKPPLANAGADKSITLPTNNSTLNGSGSDTDGSISGYSWIKISGPATGQIVAPNASNTIVINLVQGVYSFQLTVKDNKGATGKDTIKITVNGALNQVPKANAGTNKNITLPTNSTSLNGDGTDLDGTISSYAWAKISGPASGIIASPNSSVTAINNLKKGIYEFELTVVDNEGAISNDTVKVTVIEIPNQAPQADAGADQAIILPTNITSISGSGTDADGSIASYLWTKISGPANGTIVSPDSASSTLNNLVQGIYNFELTVTDNDGASSKDSIEVTVIAAPNQVPVANAGTNIVITLPVNYTNLTGGGIDADGTISVYAWTKLSGPANCIIASPSMANTTVSNLNEGIYQFELTVTDNNGAFSRSIVQVTVKAAPNQPPVAIAGADMVITLPTNNTNLNGSGTDSDGTITSYKWIKISGPAIGTIVLPNSAYTPFSNLIQGEYQIELTVTDNIGEFTKDTAKVTVNAALNQAPECNAGQDISITLPANNATLNGSGTDPDGTIINYAWVKISGPVFGTIVTPNSGITAIINLTQGVYLYELSVTDNDGDVSKDTVTVTVNAAPNQAPVSNAGQDITVTLPTNSIYLSGSGTDSDGTIINYAWLKISGPSAGTIASANDATTVVNNLLQGLYQFELTVTDNSGATAKDTVMVFVNAATNLAPMANAGTDITITLPVNNTTLNGSGTDADGMIANYAWVKISGPASGTIATANAAATVVNNLVQGLYQFELTVTDNSGETAKDTVLVFVNAAINVAPLANAGIDITISLPINNTILNGSGTDADGTITGYSWIKISGPTNGTIAASNSSVTSINNLVQGIYLYELAVTDNNGAIGKDTVQVTVKAATLINQLPIANAGPDINIVLPTNSVLLKGTGTDPDGTIVTYTWKVINGPTGYSFKKPNSSETIIENLFQGVYNLEFTVVDNNGAIAKDTINITVSSPRLSNSSSNDFKVYPNPVKDIANLKITTVNKNTKLSITVVDVTGKLLKNYSFVTEDYNTIFKIDMSNLSNSYYIVTLRFDDGTILNSKVFKNSSD